VRGDLEARLLEVIAHQLGVERAELTPASRFVDDLGADSLDVVELVMALEEAFDVDVPDEDVAGLVTIADVQRYVRTRLGA
jgi:acyl carrier protein